MTTEIVHAPALPATTQSTDEKRGLALVKALGLDRVPVELRELTLAIADRYGLDPMLRHLVLVDGKPFITRDGLLHVAHRSGVFDGIEVTTPTREDKYWRCTATVWRKDMTRPFVYPGRYPAGAKNDEEMGIKVAESMALRRAFDVSAPTLDERWASDDADDPAQPAEPRKTLAELARSRAESVAAATQPAQPAQDAPSAPEGPQAEPDAVEAETVALCASTSPYEGAAQCVKPDGHRGTHRSSESESWQ